MVLCGLQGRGVPLQPAWCDQGLNMSGMTAPIRFLQSATQSDWVDQAIAHLDTVLLDHSHCERKAAGVALNLMFRYPAHVQLVKQLTAIAREELEHFDQVNDILAARGIALGPLAAPPYGAKLSRQIRSQEPERLLDALLVSGLIEARSHERLGLLAERLEGEGDEALASFYRALMKSEARHYGVYWTLADMYFERGVVMARLAELAAVESEILAVLYPEPRIHS
jgi:tRNA 2-(methylsulfanyl)-N6-isopentenyladenosine37 hydroxylase